MLGKLAIAASFLGFLAVGGLLATGHSGFATKFVSYLYFLILVSVFWSLSRHEIKK